MGANDPVYLPLNAAPGGDIDLVVRKGDGWFAPAPPAIYAQLDSLIRSEGCLQQQRGQLMRVNSCRNGWLGFLNAQVVKRIPLRNQHGVDVAMEIFDVLNLLNSRWGTYRLSVDNSGNVLGGSGVALLQLVGYDVAKGQGLYSLILPNARYRTFASQWRVQLGLRYSY